MIFRDDRPNEPVLSIELSHFYHSLLGRKGVMRRHARTASLQYGQRDGTLLDDDWWPVGLDHNPHRVLVVCQVHKNESGRSTKVAPPSGPMLCCNRCTSWQACPLPSKSIFDPEGKACLPSAEMIMCRSILAFLSTGFLAGLVPVLLGSSWGKGTATAGRDRATHNIRTGIRVLNFVMFLSNKSGFILPREVLIIY